MSWPDGTCWAGTYSVWEGNGTLSAGRTVGLGTTADLSQELGVTIASGAGTMAVNARQDLDIGLIINPTVIPARGSPSSVYFYTYLPDDALNLTSVGGRLRILNDFDAFAVNIAADAESGSDASLITAYGIAAPILRAWAPSGDFELPRALSLLPSPSGQAEIIARGSVIAADRSVPFVMSDVDPAQLPTADVPAGGGAADLVDNVVLPSKDVIHAGDGSPALLIAAAGDILGGAWQFAKHFRAIAGGDIRDLSLTGQNTSAGQISLIQAGRDVDLNARDNPRELVGQPHRAEWSRAAAGARRTQREPRFLPRHHHDRQHGERTAARRRRRARPLDRYLAATPDYAGFNAKYWDEQYSDEFDRYLAGPEGGMSLIEYVAGVTGRTDLTTDNVWGGLRGPRPG